MGPRAARNGIVAVGVALVLAGVGCRRRDALSSDAGASAAEASTVTIVRDAGTSVDAEGSAVLPALDAEAHCASLRAIVGKLGLVDGWWRGDVALVADDAGAAREGAPSPGGVRVSGFTECSVQSRDGNNSSFSYYCDVVRLPDDVAARRFSALLEVWRGCLKGSPLREELLNRGSYVAFTKPGTPTHHMGCSLKREAGRIVMLCADSHNN